MYDVATVQAYIYGGRASWAEPRFLGVVRRKVALQEARTASIRPSSSAEKLSPMSNSSWKNGSSQSERQTSSQGILEQQMHALDSTQPAFA